MASDQEQNGFQEASVNGLPQPPEWLNERFFAEILKKEFGKIEIINFHTKPALAKGENYASAMFRVGIDIKLKDETSKSVNYIVKTTVQSELAHKMIADMSLFAKEIDMYEKIVPQIEAMYREVGVEFNIGPKCVKTQQKPAVIVLEDLKVKNYKNIDRLSGMDLKHTEATLEKLAQFHAATARIYQRRGRFPDHFHKGMFPPEFEAFASSLIDAAWPVMEECIRKWDNSEKYMEKLKTMNYKMFELLRAVEAVDPLEFNVLNHGDMWSNNIMFDHNEDGSINDVKLVDLQICTWGSPVRDLQYFIISSCNNDIRIEKFDYLVKYYHDKLISNLELVKYSGELPTLQELQRQLQKRGYFSVNVAFGVLTVVLLDSDEDADISAFLEVSERATNFRRKLFSNPRYVKAMKTILPFLDDRGLFDI